LEELQLPHILEKISELLQRTHELRSGGFRVDPELRRLAWLNDRAERLLEAETASARERSDSASK
jgi:hypothetical protein